MEALLWPLVKGGVILATLIGVYFWIKRSGVLEQRLMAAERSAKRAEKANEIDEDIARMAQPDVDQRLRQYRRR